MSGLCFNPLTDRQTQAQTCVTTTAAERLGFTGTCQELLSVDEGPCACVWMMDGGRHIKTYLNSTVKPETWERARWKSHCEPERSLLLVCLLPFLRLWICNVFCLGCETRTGSYRPGNSYNISIKILLVINTVIGCLFVH